MRIRAVFLLGCIAFSLTHLAFLREVPGLHFDEAWAANFSARLASEPESWTIRAMSPYTAPWGHYWAAGIFRAIGTNLEAFRWSGFLLALGGVLLLSQALRRIGESRAADLLPLIAAFFVPSVLNHRFCIDVTTVHVFCFGLLALGLARRSQGDTSNPTSAMIVGASVIGLTSHVAFLAPLLGALGIPAFFSGGMGRRDRLMTGIVATVALLFFIQIHLGIPEKEKSLALIVLAASTLLWIGAFQGRRLLPERWERVALGGFAILSLPMLFFLFFFSEGSWSVLFTHGELALPFWIGGIPALLALLGALARRDLKLDPRILAWFVITVFVTGAIAVKPAPRFFEIGFLFLAAGTAIALSRVTGARRWIWILLFVLQGSVQLGLNYFAPALLNRTVERDFRFLFFRDNSSDSLPKQKVAYWLSARGCSPQEVRTSDSRMQESFQFLARGDWKLLPGTRCQLHPPVLVERTRTWEEMGRPKDWFPIGPFQLRGSRFPGP